MTILDVARHLNVEWDLIWKDLLDNGRDGTETGTQLVCQDRMEAGT